MREITENESNTGVAIFAFLFFLHGDRKKRNSYDKKAPAGERSEDEKKVVKIPKKGGIAGAKKREEVVVFFFSLTDYIRPDSRCSLRH